MKELARGGLLHLDERSVTGRTIGEQLASVPPLGEDAASGSGWCGPERVVFPLQQPLARQGGIAVLRGNLAPDGAVVKQSAVSAQLMRHRGQAIVFSSSSDLAARIDDPQLEVSADSVLVLQNAGPKGAPGMPEAGGLPIPKKLLAGGLPSFLTDPLGITAESSLEEIERATMEHPVFLLRGAA